MAQEEPLSLKKKRCRNHVFPIVAFGVFLAVPGPAGWAKVTAPVALPADAIPYQVEIEVIVADLAKEFANELGFVYRFLQDPEEMDDDIQIGDSNILLHTSDVLQDPLRHGFQGLDVQGRLLSVDFGEFQARLQAAIGESEGEILARPRIMTLDKVQAQITTGQDIPYLSRKSTDLSATVFTSDYVATGVGLTVTPEVHRQGEGPEDDYIHMDVSISVKFVSRYTVDSDQALPIVATRSAKTSVVIQDNHTFGIGGLYRVDYQKIRRSVPFAGDIPYVGSLFTSRNDGRSESELVVFVTGRIDRNIEYELNLLTQQAAQEAPEK